MPGSPLGGGALFRDHSPRGERVSTALREVADAVGAAEPGQVALAWLMRHPSRPVPVLGTGRAARLADLAGACDLALEREAWFRILEASVGHPVP